jgi:K+-transporting ATPase A subunit
MAGLTVHNFVSAAVGVAIALALIRMVRIHLTPAASPVRT